MNFLDPFLTLKGGAEKISEYVVFHALVWATPPSPFGVRRAWATHRRTENPLWGGLTSMSYVTNVSCHYFILLLFITLYNTIFFDFYILMNFFCIK